MTLPQLHSLYCTLTGFPLRLDMLREREWFEWEKAGGDAERLRLVVGYLIREIKAGKRNPGCLKFSNLIRNYEGFEEDYLLALAFDRITQKQAKRPVLGAGKAAVMRATGRETERPTAKPEAVAAIVAQCLEKMRRDTL